MKRILTFASVGLAISLSSALASPTGDAAGTVQASPSALTVGASSTSVGSVSGSMSSGTFTANYIENVFSDPNNEFCAGCLDWVIQITDTAGDPIEAVKASNFGGLLTDIGVSTNGAPGMTNGTVNPYTVDRSSNGNVITWDFTGTAGSNEIYPGQTSVLLEIETNSMTLVPGFLNTDDSLPAGVAAYGAATPEPMSVGLLGGGLALLGIARWRRSAKKA